MIKVIVNGANGRMGQETIAAVNQEPGLQLVGQTTAVDDLATLISETKADVVVDFTVPSVVYANTKLILNAGARPVVGTTGLLPQQIEELQQLASERKMGGVIAPNFSMAAVLMMKYAKDAAHYFSNVEIIEWHHEKKIDAPSGTAIKTAQMIEEGFSQKPSPREDQELLSGARGAKHQDIRIHSIRLPGLLAHQEVLFGLPGETLAIRYDSISRAAYMPGVCFACKKVMELDELVYGLDRLL
jgi:4-hydroxy-tetrahydrodipicolinate reductase